MANYYLLPGYGILNETQSAGTELLLPGYGIVNETVAAGGETRNFTATIVVTVTTASAALSVVRDISAAIAGSSTTAQAILAVQRELAASVAAGAVTAEAAINIERALAAAISAVVTTAAATLETGAALLDQEGFRFRADDGDEDGATWLATQDVDISLGVGVNFRLRFIVNTTGDAAAQQFRLEYKKSTDETWTAVE